MPLNHLSIVYADHSLLVIDKPAGLLAVPGRGADKQDCASLRVLQRYSDACVVHRLDQATSGLMLLARGAAMQRKLSQMFEQRAVDKQYVAIVHGWLAQDEGSIDLPIAADWPARPRRKVDLLAGKPALTRYTVISRSQHAASPTTRVLLRPYTGRTHQLRLHMMALGHMIVGDALYGTPEHQHFRMCLHSQQLSLQHPATGQHMHWQCTADF